MRGIEIIRGLAENNAWANHRLHRACSALTEADAVATRTSFFPTIRATLNHILIVDWFYIDGVMEEGKGRALFDKDEPCDTLPALRAAQTASDKKLLAFLAGLDDDAALDRTVDLAMSVGPAKERIGGVLLHMLEHSIHHRGQVHAMLSGTNVKPPQLDEWFLECDVRFREGDVGEMRKGGYVLR